MNKKLAVYIIKRILLAILTLFVIALLTFILMHSVPGGPFNKEKAISHAALEALKRKYGLDKPYYQQFLIYLKNIVTFDFGPSLKYRGVNVTEAILTGFQTSAIVGGLAIILALLVGTVLGSYAAVKHNKWQDKLIMVLSTACIAMPSFVIASLFLILFGVKFPIFPTRGDTFAGLILPIISLSLYPMSYITRLSRSSMLDVLGQDYIRTALAKGVPKKKIIFKHALKNALTPVITYAGPMTAFTLTGSMVVESIFSVPGLGRRFVDCVLSRDYPMIMGTTAFLAILVIIMTLISDILYKVVDPRVKLD
ncbi:MAG TPA: ABC transporter permease [Clostridia bacterium]